MRDSHKKLILALMCALLLSSCATTRTQTQGEAETDPIDPYENLNRKSYDLTDMLDRKILEPIANVYMDYVPLRMQRSIGYFYDNLEYPNVVLNDFLQGKVSQGFGDALRFLINSTVGLAGLFDVASPMGFPQHDEDFGQTLGVWGIDATTYIFIPFLGPSSNRDLPGVPVAFGTHVLFYVGTFVVGAPVTVPLSALGVIQKRARLSGPMRIRDEAALEPYLFVRDSYLQQRKHLIYDGSPPPESYDDFEDDEPPVQLKK